MSRSGPLSIVNTVGEAGRSGLSSTLTVKCTHCGNLNNVNTSRQHRAGSRGPLASDVNTLEQFLDLFILELDKLN